MSEYAIAKGGVIIKGNIATLEEAVGIAERMTPAKVYKLVGDLQWPQALISGMPETITRETMLRVWDALQPPQALSPDKSKSKTITVNDLYDLYKPLRKLTQAQESALEAEAHALMDRVNAIVDAIRKSRGPLPGAVEP